MKIFKVGFQKRISLRKNNGMEFDIEKYLSDRRELIEGKLLQILPQTANNMHRLYDSMRYSIVAGGKRLRPILCIAASEAVGGSTEEVLAVSCAIEMIHTYSLIHDDLPSMDDDNLRRGMPTNHSVFGEALAILAGDALLTDAFYVIANEVHNNDMDPVVAVDIIRDISNAAGSHGMVNGQAIDIGLEGNDKVCIEDNEKMHLLKTGALIEASVIAGGKIGGADKETLTQLRAYARDVGLAYQIIDDVLDVEGGGETGKNRGADERRRKSTYPGIIGLNNSKQSAQKLTERAIHYLEGLDERANPLRELAYYMGGRKY